MSIGFSMCATQPAWYARSFSCSIACALSATTGTPARARIGLQPLGGFVAVHHRHADVHQDQVGALEARRLDALEAIGRDLHRIAGALEHEADQVAVDLVVFHQQDTARHRQVAVNAASWLSVGKATGSVNLKHDPCPRRLVTPMVPPISARSFLLR